jgi:hypothetical protein
VAILGAQRAGELTPALAQAEKNDDDEGRERT